MERKLLTDLYRITERVGYKRLQRRFSITMFLYSIIVPFLIIGSYFYAFNKWDKLEKRMNGFKGIVVYLVCLMYYIAIVVNWNTTSLVLKTIEEGYYEFPFQVTQRRKSLVSKIEDDLIKLNHTWGHSLFWLTVGSSVSPILVFFIRIKQHGFENVTPQILDLPPPFYFPDNYNTYPYLFASFIINCFFWAMLRNNVLIAAVTPFLAMQMMTGDKELLRLSLQEMDSIIESNSANQNYDLSLKIFITYLINHEYSIQRKIKTITIGMQFVAVSIQFFMALSICLTMFVLVQGTEFAVKIQEVIFLAIISFCLYCYDMRGERLTNEDENLRNALYDISWLDKPAWFRKSLLIIMTRTNKPVEINFGGVYFLRLKNFGVIMQGAYSLYNLLNNLK